MNTTKGKFLVIEGMDGAGKTASLQFLADKLKESGQSYIQTKEPRTDDFSMSVREGIVSGTLTGLPAILAMGASRDNHIKKVIIPALEEGKHVLCDRYIDSTLAYQVWCGIGKMYTDELEVAMDLIHHHASICKPDLGIMLSVDPEVAMSRINARGSVDPNERLDKLREYAKGYEFAVGFNNEDQRPNVLAWPRAEVSNNRTWAETTAKLEEVIATFLK